MVFSKEFEGEIIPAWRSFLARTGAKPVYWQHPDFEKRDYDDVGDLCPVKSILSDGKFVKSVFQLKLIILNLV